MTFEVKHMVKEQSLLRIKTEALLRRVLCHTFSGSLPIYIITEYPKSGGTWFCQMLADYLQVPFPRNQIPSIRAQVQHVHYKYHPSIKNVTCVVRDGRDVMVSYYYHSLFVAESKLNSHVVRKTKQDLRIDDPENVRENLGKFIEYKFSGKGFPRFTWVEFIDSWMGKNVPLVKYEDLLINATPELSRILNTLTGKLPDQNRLEEIERNYKFEKLAGRKAGNEKVNSFLRKGIAGDWKNTFTREAKEIFNYYAGDTLVKLGYEDNDSWVNE